MRNGQAVAEVYCLVYYDAHVTYTVPGTGVWDDEEDTLMFEEHDDDQFGTSNFITAEVTFAYREEDPSMIEYIEDVSLSDWSVSVDCQGIADRY